MVKLYGKPIRVNKASQDKKTLDIGANLFIGNLGTSVGPSFDPLDRPLERPLDRQPSRARAATA